VGGARSGWYDAAVTRLGSVRASAAFLLAACLAAPGCNAEAVPERSPELVGPRNLRPLEGRGPPRVVEKVVYVPIYSSLYVSDHVRPVSLVATLSLRNISEHHTVIIDAVEYYDSDGVRLESYLEAPAQLGPLMTAEFFVSRFDRAGGSGANFIVRWSASEPGPDLLVEAVQQGRDGNAGISFVTEGRVVEVAPGR
jgi:Protein of unknown function (DUF3124)